MKVLSSMDMSGIQVCGTPSTVCSLQSNCSIPSDSCDTSSNGSSSMIIACARSRRCFPLSPLLSSSQSSMSCCPVSSEVLAVSVRCVSSISRTPCLISMMSLAPWEMIAYMSCRVLRNLRHCFLDMDDVAVEFWSLMTIARSQLPVHTLPASAQLLNSCMMPRMRLTFCSSSTDVPRPRACSRS